MKYSRKLRLGVVLWMGEDYGRRVLSGVLDYAHKHSLDQVRMIYAGELYSKELTVQGVDSVDGTIICLDRNELERGQANGLPEPKVFVPRLSSPGLTSSVSTDARLVGKMAAEHLLSLRIENATVIRRHEVQSFADLVAGFEEAFQEGGATARTCPFHVNELAHRHEEAMRWMRSLPPKSGILCQNDRGVNAVVETIQKCGRTVPDDIAVLGVGNNCIHCMVSRPTITSIDIPAERAGWLAADMLARKCRGEPVKPIVLLPVGIIQRDSTATLAVKDAIVSEAVRIIRLQATNPISVGDVARELGISRSTLYRRFEVAMGCGIHEEIARLRLAKAVTLLANTSAPIKSVASAVGIEDQANFSRFMKQHTGLSAPQYRKKFGNVAM